jgi:hypothetical protein
MRAAGIAVEVVAAPGTELVRVRVLRAGGRPLLSFYKRAPQGRGSVRLTPRELRTLRAGNYALEVAGARHRGTVGRAVSRRFRIVR